MDGDLNEFPGLTGEALDALHIDEVEDAKEPESKDQPAEAEAATNDAKPDDGSETEPSPDDIEDEAEPEKEGEKPTEIVLKDGSKVTLTELESGYLRNADYTRKTQEVAEQRREVQAAQERLTTIDTEVRASLDLAAKVLEAYLPRQPDPAMIESDPQGYLRANAAYNQALGQLNQLSQAQQMAQARNGQMSEQEQRAALQAETQKLHEKAPQFAKADYLNDFRQRAIKHGAKIGLGPDEIGQLSDHREILVLEAATKYWDLLEKKASTIADVTKAPKVMRPGVAIPSSQKVVADRKAQESRLRQTGSIEDAMALLPNF